MAAFVFKLEPLLKTRKRAEQEAQRAVAELDRQRLELEAALRRCQSEISRDKAVLRASMTGDLDMRDLRMGAGAALHAVRGAQQTALRLAGLMQRLEAARAVLIEATKARRALELLRDRRYAQWKAALDRAETAALDELATARAARAEEPVP